MRAHRALILGLPLACLGCMDITQTWVLYPDGSGRLTVTTVTQGVQTEETSGRGQVAPFEGMIPGTWETASGDDPGTVRMREEFLFEDFRKVTNRGRPVGAWRMESDGRLEVGLSKEATGRQAPSGGTDPAPMLKLLASQMGGFRFRMEMRLPGKIKQTNGECFDERTAFLEVTRETLLDDRRREAIVRMSSFTASSGPASPLVREEWDRFRGELARTRQEWEAARADEQALKEILDEDHRLGGQVEDDR